MIILELFCGTKSISKAFEMRGHHCTTVDIEHKFEPDVCTSVFNLENKQSTDIIWASPPCTTFSVASIGTHWKGGKGAYTPKTYECELGLNLLRK